MNFHGGPAGPSLSLENTVLLAVWLCFTRSLSQDRSSPSPWTDLLAQPHKHKDLANYCSLLQEHYHQSYVKGDLPPPSPSMNMHLEDVRFAQKLCSKIKSQQGFCGVLKNLLISILGLKKSSVS